MTHREELWNKAEKRLYELYGDAPDLSILNRFLTEKMALAHFGVAEYFDELASICRESLDKHNEKMIPKNTANCFTAYLLGASEINPLPMHYFCSKCKRVEWAGVSAQVKCLLDMKSTRKCECGSEMHADGFDLPWETYLPYAEKLKTKDSVPENYSDLFEALTKKHFQFSLLKVAQTCHLLGQATGVSPDEIDLGDREVKALLLGGNFSCAPPKLAEFLKNAYAVVKPRNYNELLKLIGLAHGTGTWRANGEILISDVDGPALGEIPATRDEVFMWIRDTMRKRGIYETGFAYEIATKVHRGFFAENEDNEYITNYFWIHDELGFDDWGGSFYISSVRYMSTKALAVLYLKYTILLTWYQSYFPREYAELSHYVNDTEMLFKFDHR